ncbi:ABC transporter permease [Candidatus Parcubacteria bacterium]|nr:ABC transporter permease [Candidatus Parcubacteria bacterium]
MDRRFITLSRVFRSGSVNFVRNISLSVAATAVMVVTLTIVLFSVIANATFNHTIQQINDKIGISVYLKDSVNEEQRNELLEKLQENPEVKSVEYISKEKALEDYRKEKKNDQDADALIAVASVENPLPETVRIKPHEYEPDKIASITALIESPEVKELYTETSYSGSRKDAIDKITNATSFFKRAVFAGVVIFAVISMLLIFNTIQMAIFNRREELNIMRLLGANPWYIRGPFIVEAMLYGIVSAVISLLLINSLFVFQSQAFGATSLGLLDLQYTNTYFASNFWWILLLQLGAGIAIGVVSSLIATHRYLRVSHPMFRQKLEKLRLRK